MSLKLFNKDFFTNINLIFKPRLLIPNDRANSIDELPEKIEKLRVKSLIFDVDQTLLSYRAENVPANVLEITNRLLSRYSCCILSNLPNKESVRNRLMRIEKQTKIKVIFTGQKKPAPFPFFEVLNFLNAKPHEAVMIGDRIFTDIIGANNVNIKTILMNPINPKEDPLLMVKLPRRIEKILFYIYRLFLRRNHNG